MHSLIPNHLPHKHEKRSLPRIKAEPLRAWLTFKQGRHTQETALEVRDLTRHGVQLASQNELLAPGDRVTMRLFDPGLNSGKPIINKLDATVRYQNRQDNDYLYGLAFEFRRWFGDHSRYTKLYELEAMLYKRNRLAP